MNFTQNHVKHANCVEKLTFIFSSRVKNISLAVLFRPFFIKRALADVSLCKGVYFPSGPELTIEVEDANPRLERS